MIDREIAKTVCQRRLTYLSSAKLGSLFDCLEIVCRLKVDGDFAEFGIALGGSSICIASTLDGERTFFGFDVFEMIPPPSERDGRQEADRYRQILSGQSPGIDGDQYYGYRDNLREIVAQNFKSLGFFVDDQRIRLIKGLFEQTLPNSGLNRISFAHIDCDWYDSVAFCLYYIWPRLSPGGIIVLDDFNDWDGCMRATNDFLLRNPGARLCASEPHAIISRSFY